MNSLRMNRVKPEMRVLTAWYDHPDEIREEVVPPEVVGFRPAVRDPFVVVIEHARGIVENKSIDLAERHHSLERMPERMLKGDH